MPDVAGAEMEEVAIKAVEFMKVSLHDISIIDDTETIPRKDPLQLVRHQVD